MIRKYLLLKLILYSYVMTSIFVSLLFCCCSKVHELVHFNQLYDNVILAYIHTMIVRPLKLIFTSFKYPTYTATICRPHLFLLYSAVVDNKIKEIKTQYKLGQISWNGDPCSPTEYTWEGLTCDYSKSLQNPRIVTV
jgi:hypothetical protein